MNYTRRLLENHRIILSRRKVLKLLLEDCERGSMDVTREEPISAEVPLSTCLNDLGRHAKSPETFAGYELSQPSESSSSRTTRIKAELADIERELRLHSLAMAQLTDEEQVFVKLHYDHGIPMTALADRVSYAWPDKGKSLSTLKRMKRRITEKISRILSDC